MIVGVSRVKQFKACNLQWWFSEVAEIKLGHSYGQVFGNVLHACVERWLKEEDPYPAAWQWCPESRQRVDHGDDDLIQDLITQAIDKGFLRRHPERKVEHTWWSVIESDRDHGNFNGVIVAKGTIDLCEPRVIVDHKGTKNAKYYAKTKEELKVDIQLLVYLYVNECSRNIRHKDDDLLTVGHINYCRASRKVTERNVQVRWADAVHAWVEFKATARRMLPLARETDFRKVPKALDFPAREDGKRTCDDYAGCGYLSICSSKNPQREFEKFKVKTLRACLPSQAKADFEKHLQESVNMPKTKAKAVEQDEDEDEAPAPKPAKKKVNPFRDTEVEADEDDEEPAPPPKPKKKAAPVVEADEDDEEPAPPPKPKKKAAPVVEEAEDEDEDEDEDDEEPAPKPKKKAPVEDDEAEPVKKTVGPSGSIAKAGAKSYRAFLGELDKDELINLLARIRAAVLGNTEN